MSEVNNLHIVRNAKGIPIGCMLRETWFKLYTFNGDKANSFASCTSIDDARAMIEKEYKERNK